MECEKEVRRFRMDMMRKMPFYGDILMRLPFLPSPGIPTARTDGRQIEYSPAFFQKLEPAQQHYVLLHEMLHVLLFHCRRSADKDPGLWNTAADLIVNSMLDQLSRDLNNRGITCKRPPDGIYGYVQYSSTVENVYEALRLMNRPLNLRMGTVSYPGRDWKHSEVKGKLPRDLVYPKPGRSDHGRGAADGGGDPTGEAMLAAMIREALENARGEIGSFYLPEVLLKPAESRRLDWKSLLRSYLTEEMSEESSYITPERKYLHMDLILPGYSRDESRIEEIWAFVDSSGSISKNQLEEFLTQLSRISREFKCVFHIAYWDTEVTEVYRKVTQEKKIWESLPRHYGGTDINCVYRWLRKEKLRPAVMLILTDGYFGPLRDDCFIPSLKNNTILVLSGGIPENGTMRRIGKIARL